MMETQANHEALTASIVACRGFLSGKKVIDFSRKGELHLEELSGAKS